MANTTSSFKNANSHAEDPAAVPAFGSAITVGPHGRAVLCTHSFTDVTDYDAVLQLASGDGHWVDIPYAYAKAATPAVPAYITAENLPVGSSVRASIPRITGDEGILATTVLTDD